MLKDIIEKIKSRFLPKEDEIILAVIIILTALIGFILGRLSVLKDLKFPIQISAESLSEIQSDKQSANLLVGSKNGSVYHYPSCLGAKRIKEENKIYFTSLKEAQKAGYRPAANCPGL